MKTIQYMGSKNKLLRFLEASIFDYIGNDESCFSFQDVFSGSGRVSYHFSPHFDIVSVDKQYFSKVILDAYLNNTMPIRKMTAIIKRLNQIGNGENHKCDYWFTNNYGGDFNNGSAVHKNGTRRIWLTKNSRFIDVVRNEIDRIYPNYSSDKAVLLLSLILASNKVSNVMGHQNGYLKRWSKASMKDIHLEVPDVDVIDKVRHINLCGDVFDICPNVETDISYIDPPYGTNNKKVSKSGHTKYSSFYHLWNTLVKNDRPELWGKANKPMSVKNYTGDLEYIDKESVRPKMIEMLNCINSRYLFFSYSNKGLFTLSEMKSIFKESKYNHKSLKMFKYTHTENNQKKNARLDGSWIDRENEDDDLIEYLFALQI